MGKLDNKIAVVTGAARGMGFGVSKVLAKHGATVAMISKGENVFDSAEELRKEGYQAEGFVASVQDYDEVKKVVDEIAEKYGRIDILVCAAGIAPLMPFTDERIFKNAEDMMNVNFWGVWNTNHAVIPYMLKNGGGKICNFSSVTGVMVCDAYYSSYAASKAAIMGLTKGLAAEFADQGININAILPGTIRTPMVEKLAEDIIPDDPDKVIRDMENCLPMRRLGTIEEAGEVVAFLVSDEASYVTGANMLFDGGSMLPEFSKAGL